MKKFAAIGLSLATLLVAGAGLASGAAASPFIFKSGAAIGTGEPAVGVLQFGTCAMFQVEGPLLVTSGKAVLDEFTGTESAGGGCGEGGPLIEGSIESFVVTRGGKFFVRGSLTYTTTGTMTCSYALFKLKGAFAVPGTTVATLSGVGKHMLGNPARCPKRLSISGAEAELSDLETGEPFEIKS